MARSRKSKSPPRLSGRSLRAAVAASESAMVGRGFKELMFKQLGMGILDDVDLAALGDPAPLVLPSPHPAPHAGATGADAGDAPSASTSASEDEP